MKKIAILLLSLISLLTLTACQPEEEEPFVHNVPKEGNVYLDTLPYYKYISLNNPVVTITIQDIGEIKLQLFEEVAPNTVYNFVKYITDNAYEGSTFHRVISGFMIQGGMVEETTCVIEGEFSSNGIDNPLEHDRGVLSMARTNVKNSASSQFFIMHAKSTHLDGEYAAFGGVVSGFNVLDYIASLETDSMDMPVHDAIITSITIDLKGNDYPDPVCVD
jgi:peptidyl-prolyl cis-trans isomerase B (cyclophilin B)